MRAIVEIQQLNRFFKWRWGNGQGWRAIWHVDLGTKVSEEVRADYEAHKTTRMRIAESRDAVRGNAVDAARRWLGRHPELGMPDDIDFEFIEQPMESALVEIRQHLRARRAARRALRGR